MDTAAVRTGVDLLAAEWRWVENRGERSSASRLLCRSIASPVPSLSHCDAARGAVAAARSVSGVAPERGRSWVQLAAWPSLR
jgi:hypothetical protein